jgi:putative salt-induced outer membrane protein YdiY
MPPHMAALAACTLLLAATPALAQNGPVVAPPSLPASAHTTAPPAAAPPRWHAEIDLGLVSAAGNSSVRTLNGAEHVTFAPEPWRFSQTFSLVNGYTHDSETVNTLKAGLRADYAVGNRFRLFALGTFTRDRFAGIARRFEEAAGLAFVVLPGSTNVLDVEAGAGRTQQTSTAGERRQYWASRLASHYRLNLTSRAYFDQKVEVLFDLQNAQNMLLNTESSVVAPISSNVGLKLGYVLRFANQPPGPGIRKADTVLSAGLQLVF